MKYYELRDGKCICDDCENAAFDVTYDLIVAGLGSAGAFLALSAAREGISVLGVERGTCCGGMSTMGVINGYYNGFTGGTYEDIDIQTAESIKGVYSDFYNHPDCKKLIIEKNLKKYNVRTEYRSVVLGVYIQGDTVKGVRLIIDKKVVNYGCKFLSDSTSDGHILRMLGITGNYGRPTDGATAPFSGVMVFRRDRLVTRTNYDSGYINPYNDENFTTSCIKANAEHFNNLERENDRYLYMAPLIGNREGMTFCGEQYVTLKDVLKEKEWSNTLFCAFSDIDKHGFDRAFDDNLFIDWFVISNLSTVTFKVEVPLGAIVPKDIKGMVCVSRCLSIDSYASSAVRMNRDMYRMGEAAGVAVAMAVKSGNCNIMNIEYSQFRSRVEQLGCYNGSPEKTKGFVLRDKEKTFVPVDWLTDLSEIERGLSSDCPGVAIWSCRRMSSNITEWLCQKLGDENVNLKYNAAIALGLLNDKRAVPVLREILNGRSEYHFLDCRRSNQMRSVIAICLLGRFGDTECVTELESILTPAEYEKPMYHVYKEENYKLSIIPGFNSVYYQHFSFTVAALLNIAKMNPNERENIFAALLKATENEDYIKRITDSKKGDIYFGIAEDLYRKITQTIDKISDI